MYKMDCDGMTYLNWFDLNEIDSSRSWQVRTTSAELLNHCTSLYVCDS